MTEAPPHLRPEALPNVNALWAALLVEELLRQGVGLFVVCPGSRSTPLAVAVARAAQAGRCEWLVHPDERAAAFVALGWGRARGTPAAVVTTSGSAVAHLFPAVVEADAAGVPLLLLTADRPPELRETGANQTIRQPGLFGGFVRWAFDLPPPTADVDPAFVLTTAAHAVARSLAPAGPVHLNLAFREPLGLEPDGTDAAALLEPLGRWARDAGDEHEGPRPYTERSIGDTFPRTRGWISDEMDVERGIVILGPGMESDTGHLAQRIADGMGWPFLVDVGARLPRTGTLRPVSFYELALASPAFVAKCQLDFVLLIGGRPVSKRLWALIDDARPREFWVVKEGPDRLDPSHRVTWRLESETDAFLRRVAQGVPQSPRPSMWKRRWQRASGVADQAASDMIGRGLSEPFVARAVTNHLPAQSALVLAASMPIRDVNAFGRALPEGSRVVANRGASGIDGTVATAHGVARALGTPTLALVGDLALIHDQTSLMLLRSGPPVVVVVVNNDGGGIFHFLPVARGAHPLDPATFEAAMAAPHGLTFAHAAAQVGLPYHAPETADAFEAALDAALGSGQSALIEVRTDRAENERLHARILDAVRAAVDATL